MWGKEKRVEGKEALDAKGLALFRLPFRAQDRCRLSSVRCTFQELHFVVIGSWFGFSLGVVAAIALVTLAVSAKDQIVVRKTLPTEPESGHTLRAGGYIALGFLLLLARPSATLGAMPSIRSEVLHRLSVCIVLVELTFLKLATGQPPVEGPLALEAGG
jgi:hypothetical protein